jgi:hypothetical protein
MLQNNNTLIENTDNLMNEIKKGFDKYDCVNDNLYTSECNDILKKKELYENKIFLEDPSKNDFLYPNLNDPNFNIKIAQKKEFNDTKYDGELHKNVKEYADLLSNSEFEISPHQTFVKNFLSFHTPYNSLLLYHGLGTGKTCSAIGISEEMRDYLKQIGIFKKIIIVASENVQNNFKLQLFDEGKLVLVDGVWTTKGCIGNKLLKEVNPTNIKGISREKIINQVRSIINSYYIFLGYGQFANYIINVSNIPDGTYKSENEKNRKSMKKIRNEFNSRLIIIDEIHNIRMTEDNENKRVGINLELLVKYSENVRLLLLSATPMYNTFNEIIWLINLMNMNDKRSTIEFKDVFTSDGEFKKDGKELLIRKLTGYISFVRGENPYTFPYRVYPDIFAIENTFSGSKYKYPLYQMNEKLLNNKSIQFLKIYLNKIGSYQSLGYKYIIEFLKNKTYNITNNDGSIRNTPSFKEMESFGYFVLQIPLESLIITYPHFELQEKLKKIVGGVTKQKNLVFESDPDADTDEMYVTQENEDNGDDTGDGDGDENDAPLLTTKELDFINPAELTGINGIRRIMNFQDKRSPPIKGVYEYKQEILDNYGRIFSINEIGKYSCKIKSILDILISPDKTSFSEGIILIYSQHIDGGLIPMALALEELGITRYGTDATSLFKTPPSQPLNVKTMKSKQENDTSFKKATYTMITADTRLSPSNEEDIKALTNINNKNGENIKIVLISKAGSEGIDFKYIRQVHILDPWYNISQIEQIIGRAVRNLSHKSLDFEKRNVQIFMHGTILENEQEESADLYVFRLAESKAVQIGKITRILKETAIDCILNNSQSNFTYEKMNLYLDDPVKQIMSNGKIIDNFKIGDLPYSVSCDYMNCNFKCITLDTINENELNYDTYSEKYMISNLERIIEKIKNLMKDEFFYKKNVLLDLLDVPKKYQLSEKYSALTKLIKDKNEFVVDKYGRNGRLINIGDYYFFQPSELLDNNITIYDRSNPVDYKHNSLKLEFQNVKANTNDIEDKPEIKKTNDIMLMIQEKYNKSLIHKNPQIKIPRGDNDWYKHSGLIIHNLSISKNAIDIHILEQLLIDHIIDTLMFDDKFSLLNYIYSIDIIQENSIENLIKTHFNNRIITINKGNISRYLLFYNNNKKTSPETILSYHNDSKEWIEVDSEDKIEILSYDIIKNAWLIDSEKLNDIIGFIEYENKNKYMVFKTKNNKLLRNKGARCDEAGKIKTINILNLIVGNDKYNKKNTSNLNQIDLCILQEIILRYYQLINKNNKIWFINPDIALFNKI